MDHQTYTGDGRDLGALRLSADEMRSLGYRAVDLVVEHLEALPTRSVGGPTPRGELEAVLREPLPRKGSGWRAVLRQVEDDVLAAVRHLDHPRFFAQVPGPGNFVGAVADLVASGMNVFSGTWIEASGPAQVELVVVDWLREACRLPPSAGGLFVSGGSHANLTGLALARHAVLGGPDPNAVVCCSDQAHSSVPRALGVLGLGAGQIRAVRSDELGRLTVGPLVDELDRAAGEGGRPFCVVATAGTTNTGAVDPLRDVARVCADRGLWLHIDGAYGAAAAITSRGRELLAGMELADSLALDPHKWLFQPYEAGCLLVRDPALLRDAFRVTPEYLRDVAAGPEEVNFCDYGLQLTRRFNALKLWMSLKVFGADAFAEAVERGLARAEEAEWLLSSSPRWEVVTRAQLAIVTFRYVPEAGQWSADELDRLQRRIAGRLNADGLATIATTTFGDRSVLRLCTINPATTGDDVARTLDALERFGTEEAGRALGHGTD
ncbi:MAG TPA: pyridoxal-dependent decarboxylase [Acidimicrobiales bacterium]|nr:pyridoxal-dependent decarboxylase [Acidimicrobiales bacterium]